jgi:hypothetical protein
MRGTTAAERPQADVQGGVDGAVVGAAVQGPAAAGDGLGDRSAPRRDRARARARPPLLALAPQQYDTAAPKLCSHATPPPPPTPPPSALHARMGRGGVGWWRGEGGGAFCAPCTATCAPRHSARCVRCGVGQGGVGWEGGRGWCVAGGRAQCASPPRSTQSEYGALPSPPSRVSAMLRRRSGATGGRGGGIERGVHVRFAAVLAGAGDALDVPNVFVDAGRGPST